jgi:peptidoglycan/xylan/chitin deacetylase (PgdA/CDA1 family)
MKNFTKHILLTFDFELFLGEKSGSVENSLIKPTKAILDVLKKHDLSPLFFVDTIYLHRLKEIALSHPRAKDDYNQIVELLREVIIHKGYLFHHIHPHWLDAVYDATNNQWDLTNKSKFTLGQLTESEIQLVFHQSQEILNELYAYHKKPKFLGFRAGGLYAQPFGAYKKYFIEHGISIDSSVLLGAHSSNALHGYAFDYTNCPNSTIYRFSNDICNKDSNGPFIEFAINQFEMKGIPKIINGIFYRLNKHNQKWQRFGDGSSSGNIIRSKSSQSRFRTTETFSIELLNDFKARLYFIQLRKVNYINILSHPKLFSQANIDAFDKFLGNSIRNYSIETDIFKIVEEKIK